MTREEIIRWMRRFKYDPEFRDEFGSKTVLFAPFCRFAGVAKQNVRAMMRGEVRLTENYQNRLEYAIKCVEHGLRWTRRNKVYIMVGSFDPLPCYQSPRKEAIDAGVPQEVRR